MNRAKKLATAFSGLILLGFGSSANADFTGAYIGGSTGLFTSATIEEDADGDVLNLGIEDSIFTKLDVIAGYGVQQGQFYFGAEGQYTLTNNLDGRVANIDGDRVDAETGDGYAVAARIGFVPNPGLLIYGKIAYGEREFELSFDDVGSGDEDFTGVGIGLGVEYMASQNIGLRLEAMRYDYSDETVDDVDFDPIEQTVDLGIVYHF
ncbi:outer membrane beta-barrel protein [Spiribacter sp. 2438]|uniref:outer membrane protein n=1 Tax=Spiribacter sp. 2438 TaxID=2666185 RepID=UPI0012B0F7F6|nr:outer membrane beta-barrel protein [Spiribacter sp. 2438]QGM21432.1 outer membrane beta-barrel protein [Spiribacter sp. 2438]